MPKNSRPKTAVDVASATSPDRPLISPHGRKGRRLFILDLSVLVYNICFAASSLAPENVKLSPQQIEDVQHISLFQIASTLSILGARPQDAFVILGDGANYFRRDILPMYKAGRPPKPDSYQYILSSIQEHFPYLIINGYEADDLISFTTTNFYHLYDQVVVVTCDTDLLQLCRDNGAVYWISTGANHLPRVRWSIDSCREWLVKKRKYDLTGCTNLYEAVIKNRAECGDKSDNYLAGCDPIIYDLSKSPIHKEPSIMEDIKRVIQPIDKDMVVGAREALESLWAQGMYPCLPPLDLTWGAFPQPRAKAAAQINPDTHVDVSKILW